MDSENKFWLGFWIIVGILIFTIIVSTTIYNLDHNAKYYESWNACVHAGGTPTEQTMVGSEMRTFTCVRK